MYDKKITIMLKYLNYLIRNLKDDSNFSDHLNISSYVVCISDK